MFLYDVLCTEDVGLPTQFKFNVGPASQPIAGSMSVNRCWNNTNTTMYLLYTLLQHISKTWPSPNRVIVPCLLGLRHCYAVEALLLRLQSHFPDNTIYWPNADVLLSHYLRCRANNIPIDSNQTNTIVKLPNTFYTLKLLNLAFLLILVHMDCFAEMSTISQTRHSSSP